MYNFNKGMQGLCIEKWGNDDRSQGINGIQNF